MSVRRTIGRRAKLAVDYSSTDYESHYQADILTRRHDNSAQGPNFRRNDVADAAGAEADGRLRLQSGVAHLRHEAHGNSGIGSEFTAWRRSQKRDRISSVVDADLSAQGRRHPKQRTRRMEHYRCRECTYRGRSKQYRGASSRDGP